MSEILVLSAQDVERLITIPMAIEAVESAYRQKAEGRGGVWPMVFHEFDPGHADLDIKSGNLDDAEIYGLKVVSWYEANAEKALPALFGTTLIFDLATGAPKALLDAGPITDFRTGAAGAIGAKYLARPDSETLLMAGAGALAPYLIAATLAVMPSIRTVLLVNPHHPQTIPNKAEPVFEKARILAGDRAAPERVRFIACEDLEGAVRASDVILTATPARQPFLRADWIRPGAHISCVGADMAGKQELESAVFAKARAFGDDRAQCFAVGECEIPHRDGLLCELDAEIGEVICGAAEGRRSAEEITVFDSTGIALQDLSSAAALLKLAEEKDVGTWVTL